MRLLSLDMSTRRTGWAFFNDGKLEAYNLIEADDKNVYDRMSNTYFAIQELVSSYDIEYIVCEDVPVALHSNLQTGKDLCVLQGCIVILCYLNKLGFHLAKPTIWRSSIGLNRSLYRCKICGHEKEDISGKNFTICSVCGNKDKKQLEKNALNDREHLKRRAVEMANDVFGLDLEYISKNSKNNDDDIAEAILIGYSFLKENDDNGRKD